MVSIGARAFADRESLREIVIPPNVLTVDESALMGCKNVTVYGEKGSAAEAFVAATNEADPDADFLLAELKPEPIEAVIVQKLPPVVLPFVPAA